MMRRILGIFMKNFEKIIVRINNMFEIDNLIRDNNNYCTLPDRREMAFCAKLRAGGLRGAADRLKVAERAGYALA